MNEYSLGSKKQIYLMFQDFTALKTFRNPDCECIVAFNKSQIGQLCTH